MEITSVKVFKDDRGVNRMKGKASVVIDDAVAIHDIRILEGDNGLFIAMPSRKTPVGEYKDVAHPINKEVRAMFEKAIFDKYNELDTNIEVEDE